MGKAILRNGEIEDKTPIIHHQKCKGHRLEKYLAQELDREQREKVKYCKTEQEMKTVWREVRICGCNKIIRIIFYTASIH